MVSEELDRDRPLFDACIPVEVKRPELLERKEVVELTLRVISGTRPGGPTNAQREKVLHIEIADDEDPFFLFSLDVGEEDFHELKRDQSLLVDFNAFPNKFIELVESCLASSTSNGSPTRVATSTAGPKSSTRELHTEPHFLARLDTRQGAANAVFSLVEANKFKEVTHLSLHFRPGNDPMIKVYLAERLRQVMGERDRLSSALGKTEDQLRSETHRCKGAEAELQRLLTSREQDIRELKAQQMEELAHQRGELRRELEEATLRHAAELRDLQARKEEITNRLQARLDEVESKRSSLSDLRHASEATIRELTNRIEAQDASLEAANKDVKDLRAANRELETAKFTLDKDVSRLQLRVAALEQQVVDREQVLSKSTALQAAAEQARAKVEESLELYKANCATLQEKLEASVAEINKGNQIIQKIQTEYRSLKTKLRLKSDVMKQQERLLEEREHALEDANRRLQAAADSKANLEEQLERLKKDLATATSKLEESNRLIESNQQVITWLNKEINEAQLGRGGYTTTPTAAFTPAYHPEAAMTPTMDDTILRRYTTPTPASGIDPGTGGASASFRRYGFEGSRIIDPLPKSSLASFA